MSHPPVDSPMSNTSDPSAIAAGVTSTASQASPLAQQVNNIIPTTNLPTQNSLIPQTNTALQTHAGMVEKFRVAEQLLRQIEQSIRSARDAGRIQDAEFHERDYAQKSQKVKEALRAYQLQIQQQARLNQAHTTNLTTLHKPPASTSVAILAVAPVPPNPSPPISDGKLPEQMALPGSTPTLSPIPVTKEPLRVESSQLMTATQHNPHPPKDLTKAVSQNITSATATNPPNHTQRIPQSNVPVWAGSLTLNVQGKELRTMVLASSTTPQDRYDKQSFVGRPTYAHK